MPAAVLNRLEPIFQPIFDERTSVIGDFASEAAASVERNRFLRGEPGRSGSSRIRYRLALRSTFTVAGYWYGTYVTKRRPAGTGRKPGLDHAGRLTASSSGRHCRSERGAADSPCYTMPHREQFAQVEPHMKASAGRFRITPKAGLILTALLALGASLAPARARSQSLQEQTSIVVAFVTDTAGNPLSGAEVQIVGTSVRGNTDNAGRVALLAVPVGKATLRVRRLGFAESTIQISVTPGATPDVRSRLAAVPADLKKVVVRASHLKPERYAKTGRFDEFYRRRSTGSGTFLTREDIDARQAQRPEDLVRMASGVRIRYRGTVPYVQFLRCEQVNIYIDGFRQHDGFRDYLSLSPLQIEAMEIYHGVATVPPEFSPRPSDCGAIVVWTRWHGKQ